MAYALTFDDGPGPSTERLLDVLAKERVRATFFVMGENTEGMRWGVSPKRARGLVLRAMQEGHQIGNHSWFHFHPDANRIEPRLFVDEINRMDEFIRCLRLEVGLPVDDPIVLRLPYGAPCGSADPRPGLLAGLRRDHIMWTELFYDWDRPPAELIATNMSRHVSECVRSGKTAVLLLHDGCGDPHPDTHDRTPTVEAVELFLSKARQEGNRWEATLSLPLCHG